MSRFEANSCKRCNTYDRLATQAEVPDRKLVSPGLPRWTVPISGLLKIMRRSKVELCGRSCPEYRAFKIYLVILNAPLCPSAFISVWTNRFWPWDLRLGSYKRHYSSLLTPGVLRLLADMDSCGQYHIEPEVIQHHCTPDRQFHQHRM